MLRCHAHRRAIAATLLLIFCSSTFAPTLSFALSSGPTAPEATSFEPVDTTDMVNLQTGDFTYNIPMIEVPGPDGGYPMALSYHAGVQPNEDAGWVGLGWTLNPGAVNRSVNGFPDDWAGRQSSSRVYWSGGNTTTFSAGVNIGIAQSPFSVSFGLSVSQDTYKGFGVGFTMGLGYSPLDDEGNKTGTSYNIGIGIAPYTGKATLNFGESKTDPVFDGFGITTGINMSTNFRTIEGSASASLGLGGNSLLGASISSTGNTQYSYGIGGLSRSVSNSKAPGVETTQHGWSLTIPITSGFSISLGYSKTRYWTDESSSQYVDGSFYPDDGLPGFTVYDTYSLLDDPTILNIAAYPDPTVLQGGTFPDYDDYTVLAQGLSGVMSPMDYQRSLLSQNHKDANNNPTVTYASVPGNYTYPQPTSFRFLNDFSNSYRQQYLQYAAGTTDPTTVAPPFDPAPVYGNNDGNYGASISVALGQSVSNLALAGSRHVDLGVKVAPSNCQGYVQGDRYLSGMFNGFSITNESGVTYHYGLPAYSYGEENYQEKIDRSHGLYFNRGNKTIGYAYTWYLTTITGPDYVDRNNDGIADAGDWGYWVNFEYGKWSNKYAWRNPSQGFTRDEDNNFQDCSQGYKEIYYLNAIRTRSHIALFEKDLRQDGKGVTPLTFNKNQQNNQNGVLTQTDYITYGGFDINSSQSLQLSHIYLLNIADASLVTANMNPNNSIYTPASRSLPCSDCELPQNVLDAADVNAVGRSNLEAKAIRVIDFNYDYSLCPNTANSFDALNSPGTLDGKLTLKSINTRGKGGANLIPPTKFVYDLTGSDQVLQNGITMTTTGFSTSNGWFNVGDLITTTGIPTVYCGVITAKSGPSGGIYTYNLANSTWPGGPATANIQTTKNPAYNKDLFDSWGLYKSDADPMVLVGNSNMGRNTSPISAQSTDAWSLRRIYSPLGDYLKVNYESDTYHSSVMNNTFSFVMQNVVMQPNTNNQQISFTLANYGSSTDPSSLLHYNQYLTNMVLAVNYAGAGSRCTGVIREPVTQQAFGGMTIVQMTTTNGVTTIWGDLDHPVPTTWGGGNFSSIATGNLWINSTTDFYGGGIRVASISSHHNLDNSSSSIVYNYNSPSGVSSGVTSYLPNGLDAYDAVALNNSGGANMCELSDDVNDYLAALYKNVSQVYPIARELPPPGVMYQYVTVTDQRQNASEPSARTIEGATRYQFEVLQPGMVWREELPPLMNGSIKVARNWVIHKFTTGIGSIKSVTKFDNNGVIIGQTINHYLHDDLENAGQTYGNFFPAYLALLQQYGYQGLIEERYHEAKTVSGSYTSPTAPFYLGHSIYLGGTRGTFSARESYPCIQTGQTVINYVNGTQTSTANLAFDFYSGAVTKTLETDEYGNNFMTQSVPAYRIPQYAAMGLKIGNDNNKNMLTQIAETMRWKVDGNNNPLELVSADVTTWSDASQVADIDGTQYTQNAPTTVTLGDVWRKQSNYKWLSTASTADGLTPGTSFADFNFSTPSSSNQQWNAISNFTRYDVYSKVLEQSDINGNYGATHYDYGDQKIVLSGNGAKYYEIAYSGAEDAGINQTGNNNFVQASGGVVTTADAHTGTHSLLLAPGGTKGFAYSVSTSSLVQKRPYQAMVWVKPVSGGSATVGLYYDIDGQVKASASSANSTKTANGWTLVNLPIDGADILPGHTLNVWCRNDNGSAQAYVDDMRFQPLSAITTSYVYDGLSGELTYTLDNSNVYTNYIYDGVGRLLSVNKEKLGTGVYQLAGYQYNYASFGNAAIVNQPYPRNNCYPGDVGSTVNVSVPAGMFTSSGSQGDADAQAQQYAQSLANAQGTCTVPVTVTASNNASIVVLFKVGTTTVASATFGVGTGTMNVPAGTYNIEVIQTNQVSHLVNLSYGYGNSGTDVTFTGMSTQSPLTITVN